MEASLAQVIKWPILHRPHPPLFLPGASASCLPQADSTCFSLPSELCYRYIFQSASPQIPMQSRIPTWILCSWFPFWKPAAPGSPAGGGVFSPLDHEGLKEQLIYQTHNHTVEIVSIYLCIVVSEWCPYFSAKSYTFKIPKCLNIYLSSKSVQLWSGSFLSCRKTGYSC